jgi:HSP20 family protein
MNIIPWRRRESPMPGDLDDIWNRFWAPNNGDYFDHLPETFRARAYPAVNVAETEDGFTITMDSPGLDQKDFEIETMGNQLLISGERKWEEEKKGKEFRRVESQYGKFERSVLLPENARIEPDRIDASYAKGVLTITVPKLERTPAAKIPVHAG